MSYVDVEEYRPCGKYTRCESAPGWCSACQPWSNWLMLLAISEIEGKIVNGVTIEQQKEEVRQILLNTRGVE